MVVKDACGGGRQGDWWDVGLGRDWEMWVMGNG